MTDWVDLANFGIATVGLTVAGPARAAAPS